MPGIESRVEAAWFAKQAAKGAAAAAAVKRGRKVAGDMTVAREDSNQNWSDGERFATAEDYVNTIVGNGNPTLQAQPGIGAYLFYLMMGQETVTAVAGPAGLRDHVATPANTGAFWASWWKKVGQVVGPVRQRFDDCRMTSLRFEASSAQKVGQLVPTWTSLDPGIVYDTDPVQAEDVDRALLYTEGEGRFKINDVVFRGHSSLAFTMNDAATPWYGDSVRPHDVVFGQSTVDLEGITLLVDQQGKDFYDELIYGMINPAAGTRPRVDIPLIGSYEFDLRRGTVVDLEVVDATGGTLDLDVDGEVAAIDFDATAEEVQAAIEGLTTVLPGDVLATEGPLGTAPVRIVFLRSGRVVTADDTNITGAGGEAATATDRGHEKGFKVEFPGVKWNPDAAIAGNPDGGAVELALGGQTRKIAGEPIIRTTVRTSDAAYT